MPVQCANVLSLEEGRFQCAIGRVDVLAKVLAFLQKTAYFRQERCLICFLADTNILRPFLAESSATHVFKPFSARTD